MKLSRSIEVDRDPSQHAWLGRLSPISPFAPHRGGRALNRSAFTSITGNAAPPHELPGWATCGLSRCGKSLLDRWRGGRSSPLRRPPRLELPHELIHRRAPSRPLIAVRERPSRRFLICSSPKRSIRTFRDDDHRIADCIISVRTTRLSVTTKEERLLVGQICWLAVAENKTSTHTRPRKETSNVHHLKCYPNEKAFGRAARSRDCFHRPIIGGYACVRVRRLRSERPSRPVGPLPLGRSK